MSKNKPRILAIDDTPANLMMLGTALTDDFDLQMAASGPEGLAMAASSHPDLILLDVMMPDMDGFETCRRFKDDPLLCEIPIMFVTALANYGSELSGLNLGAVDYITKPFRVELVKQRIRNVLQLTQMSRDLKVSEERLRFVMEATGEGVWDWDVKSGLVTHNHSWCAMLGFTDDLLSHPVRVFSELIHPEDLVSVQRELDACLTGKKDRYIAEFRLRNAQGHYTWVSDHGKVVVRDADHAPVRMVGSVKNIEERKHNEAEIQRLAFYDQLTELPNRRLLIDRLQRVLVGSSRTKEHGALMFLDMDRFKQLNDTHGHAMGDLLLIQVAKRLTQCVREGDSVVRLGGDEFVVLLEHLSASIESATKDAMSVAEKILAALNKPYQLGELIYPSTPSIGVTLFGSTESSIDNVLHQADVAMYEAKSGGRNTIRLFSPAMLGEQSSVKTTGFNRP